MSEKSSVVRIKRKTVLGFVGLLIALAGVTPVLASYVGPNRTITETVTSCKVNLLECQYVSSKKIYKYKVVQDWSCPNESFPWKAYPSKSKSCGPSTDGYAYWEKVDIVQVITTTYPPATISGSLQNCTLNNGWCTTAPQLYLSGLEPLSGQSIIAIEGDLNGQNFACPDANCSVPLLEGDNTLSYWALSSLGDSSTMGSLTAKVDSQPPVVAGSFAGPLGSNGWYLGPVSFEGSASDSTSGLASFTCTIDGTTPGSCNSISFSTDGVHTFALTVSDYAGNTNTIQQDISIDTQAPILNTSLQGTLGSNNWYNVAQLHASASDPVPGSSLSAIEYNIDNTDWITFPDSGILDLPDGKHSVDVRAVDNAGNSVSSSKSFSLDSAAPDVILDPKGTVGKNNWYITIIDLVASSNDNTSGLDIFEYSLNNNPWTPYTASFVLNDGVQNISFWAQDKAGLVTQVDRVYQVDTQSPQIAGSISGTPGTNGWYVSDVTLSASAADPSPGSGVEAFTYILDGASETPYTEGLTISDGLHTIRLNAEDKAGHTSYTEQIINVDSIRPSLNIETTLPNWIKGNVTLTGIADDNGSGLSKIEISTNGGQTWQLVTGVATWSYDWNTSNDSSGTHNVLVRAKDNAGLSTEQTLNVSVDNHPPKISLPATWYQWDSVTLDIWDDDSGVSEARVEISDPDGRWPKRVIRLNPNRFPLDFKWDRRFGDNTIAPNGTYDVEVIAFDHLGNEVRQNASVKIVISILPAGPTATSQPYFRAVSTPTPAYTATPTLLPTATPTNVVSIFGNIQPTALATSTPIAQTTPRATPTQTSVLEWLESIFAPNAATTNRVTELTSLISQANTFQSTGSESNILWGAAAAAMVGSVMAYALEERRKQQEERANQAAIEEQKAESHAKRRAQKMKKLETKWAQEKAWEEARQQKEQFIEDSRDDRMEAKMANREAESDATWMASQIVMQRRAEEQKKAEELKVGLQAYYSAMRQGEKEAAKPDNWWEKTKTFTKENILQPWDEFIYEPMIEPVLEFRNKYIYQPYIAPIIDNAKEEIIEDFSWLSEKYQANVAPIMENVNEAVATGVSWLFTKVIQPWWESSTARAQNVIAFANEKIYQPYLEPIVEPFAENVLQPLFTTFRQEVLEPGFNAFNQNVLQPYVLPFLDDTKNGAINVATFINEKIYEPILEPVVKDISQYIYKPAVKKVADWWGEYGEWVHSSLDFAGFIPGIGDIADGLNGLVYLGEGKYIEAGVSLVAMIPILGDLAKTGKWGLKIGAEVVEEAAEKVVKEVTEELAEKVVKETAENLAEEVSEELAEKVAKETAENLAEEATEEIAAKVAKESADEILEKSAKESLEEVAEKTLKETGEELSSKVIAESVENTAQKTLKKELVEDAVKETTDTAVAKVAKETTEAVAETSAESVSKAVTENLAEEALKTADDKTAKIIRSLQRKLGDDVVSLNKGITLLQKHGDDAVKAFKAVNLEAAQKLLKTLDDDILDYAVKEGSDAFAVLSRWPEADLVERGMELALRAKQDAKILTGIKKLIALGPFDPNHLTSKQRKLINEIAENSIHYPDGGQVVLGKWVDSSSGFIARAKDTGSMFYNPHPDMWDMLGKLGGDNQEKVAWLVNQQVIQTGISKGLPFEYVLDGVDNIDNEVDALEALFAGETEEVIKAELMSESLPFRMQELQELKKAGLQFTFDSINNSYIFSP